MAVNVLDQTVAEKWAMYNGDCVEVIRGVPDDSIHFTFFRGR